MKKLKIALMLGKYNRSMFAEALPTHPDVEEVVAWHKAAGRLDEFDLIILEAFAGLAPGEPGYQTDMHTSKLLYELNDGQYKRKTIIWDYRADWNLWNWGVDRCLAYFKKSWPGPHKRKPNGPIIDPEKDWPSHVHYLAWPVLKLYDIPTDLYERDIDVGYYFGWLKEKRLTGRRGVVMKLIQEFDWGHDACVEFINTCGGGYHGHNMYAKSPMQDGRFNWWHVYMHFLRRTKVLFTSPAYPGFFGADRRTAEAVSSGALVFTDQPHIQMPHPFEHEKHLFFFDPESDHSIKKALEMARDYLTPEKELERKIIANAGWEHAMKYHKSSNYVNYVMDIVKDGLSDS